jgi:fatty-acyl-CoA synthase
MTGGLVAELEATAAGRGAGAELRLLAQGRGDVAIPYPRLLRMSAGLAARLPAAPAGGPAAVLVGANEPLPALLAFLAAVRSGATPLMLPGPRALGGTATFVERVRALASVFAGRAVLALEEGLVADGGDLPALPVLPLPAGPEAYPAGASGVSPAAAGAVAYLQATSASTGDGQVVAVTHGNALANLRATWAGLGAGPDERGISWLPLNHDFGLCTALYSLLHGYPLALMRPSDFIKRPGRWIAALGRHRCTYTTAPNFGYEYARRLAGEAEVAGADLSCLRGAMVGAEPTRLATLRGFADRFAACGFRADMFRVGYGLAEATMVSTMTPLGAPPRYLRVDLSGVRPGRPVAVLGEGRLGDRDAGPGVAVLSVGRPIDGIELRVLDEDGATLTGEGVLGEVALRGSSVAAGYVEPGSGRVVGFEDGLLRTGDLGLVHRGDLFILERQKHVIIRNGVNHLASLVEERLAEILRRPAHELVVLERDIHDPASPIVAIVENVAGEPAIGPEQEAELRAVEPPIDEILFARRRVIPRTTSGKKRYFLCRRLLADRLLPVTHAIPLPRAG